MSSVPARALLAHILRPEVVAAADWLRANWVHADSVDIGRDVEMLCGTILAADLLRARVPDLPDLHTAETEIAAEAAHV